MSSANATKFQNNFGTYLNEVIKTKEPVFIEKHGKKVAVLVSVKAWKEATEKSGYKPSDWLVATRQFAEKIRKSGIPQTSAVELLRELREEES